MNEHDLDAMALEPEQCRAQFGAAGNGAAKARLDTGESDLVACASACTPVDCLVWDECAFDMEKQPSGAAHP